MIQPSTLKIYNAAAGSGKTYTLVKEYLSIVLQTNDYYYFSAVLAITFTNKAAKEMKERVLRTLTEFASTNQADWNHSPLFKPLCDELGLKPVQLNERAKKTLSTILHQYSSFSISTIDKFNQRLVRSFSQDLGLNSNFEVNFEIDEIMHQTIDLLLSQLNENEPITDYLIQFAKEKLVEGNSWNIEYDLMNFSEILQSENNYFHIEKLKSVGLDTFISLKNKMKEELHTFENLLIKDATTFKNIIEQLGVQPEVFLRKAIPTFYLKIKDKKFSEKLIGKTLEDAINDKPLYAQSLSENLKELINSRAVEIVSLLKNSISTLNNYLEKLTIYKSLDSFVLLNEIERKLQEIIQEQNIILGHDFNKIIHNELKNQPVPFIYEKIGEKFKHYFIDEFQDTSTLQWGNLLPLIENQLAQNGTAMIVGDSKQSIYRWRGGNPEQFIGLSENGGGFKYEVQQLDTNYRSREEVITFNNDLYTFLSTRLNAPSYKKLYAETAIQKVHSKDKGYVSLEFYSLDKDSYQEQQLNRLVEIIRENLEKGYQYKDICILNKSKKNNMIIANHLINNNINIISQESLLLNDHVGIQFLITLLAIFDQPDNKEERFNGIVLLNQVKKIEVSDFHKFIEELINKPLQAFFASFSDFGYHFDVDYARQLGLYELMEYSIEIFQLTREGSTSFYQYFLDYILTFSSKNKYGITEFLVYWQQKKNKLYIAMPEENNAIQIMTIHKSKGLQFPVVIMGFVDWDFKHKSDKIWLDVDPNEYHSLESIYIKSNQIKESFNPEFVERKNQYSYENQLDNINLLYVATTRAEDKLYILSQDIIEKENSSERINIYLLNFIKNKGIYSPDTPIYSFGNIDTCSTKPLAAKPMHESITFFSTQWRDSLQISYEHEKYWDSYTHLQIEWGNLIHTLLAEIEVSSDQVPVVDKAINMGVIQKESSDKIHQILTSIITHPKLNTYFSDDYIVYNEREISFSQQILRPDRIVIQGNKAVVIDYKTGAKESSHHDQIKHYARALKQMNFTVLKAIIVYIQHPIEIIEITAYD